MRLQNGVRIERRSEEICWEAALAVAVAIAGGQCWQVAKGRSKLVAGGAKRRKGKGKMLKGSRERAPRRSECIGKVVTKEVDGQMRLVASGRFNSK